MLLLKPKREDFETKIENHVCPYHKERPFEPYAGCTCTSTYSLVMKQEKINECKTSNNSK